jgi:serine/threonine-protein kinase
MTQTDNFRKENLRQWNTLLNLIFHKNIPMQIKISNSSIIIDILNQIGHTRDSNYLFFPTHGGLELLGAKPSAEPSCIELTAGSSARILKPHQLIFNDFGPTNREWSHFRLTTHPLAPSNIYPPSYYKDYREEFLTETSPAQYEDWTTWQCEEFNSHSSRIRPVHRILSGDFILFAKGSLANLAHIADYAQEHSLPDQDFIELIQTIIANIEKRKEIS